MEAAELLDRLGYQASENFLRADRADFNSAVDYGHIFRRAAKAPCSLRGVYVLRGNKSTLVPIVYVCQTPNDKEAEKVHRLVWNQNVVPFLIVNSPENIRLYPGFRYWKRKGRCVQEALKVLKDFNNATAVAQFVDSLRAEDIDNGLMWKRLGKEVTPEHRVDWQLLGNLKELDRWLQKDSGLNRHVSHSLIGKYVYLHYLRDREILSPEKLEEWGIPETKVFGREASIDGVKAVIHELNEWLNGEVFPIDFKGKDAPNANHLRHVAATFAGDQPREDGSWQLHLDFEAYNFSYIPIETLSIVYEQFLHAPDSEADTTRGRSVGAYYTPIPVVNFMLSEIEEHRPLERGMRIWDFSCGSGAFLVQSYRRLIEKEFPPSRKTSPSPVELRELLEKHIFGVDNDPDACSVTEFSLILTLLDYVHPPDLKHRGPGRHPNLPKLRNRNVFCDNFFHDRTPWQRLLAKKKCDWIVGNPPWKQLDPNKLTEADEPVWHWIKEHEKDKPVGSYQTARAFAWRVAEYLADNGEIALFLPAMSLFDKPAKGFREEFFHQMNVHAIANFSNLAEVLSGRRFRAPAAAFFYGAPRTELAKVGAEETIRVFSPLVANQEATRPVDTGKRNETWNLVINASEIRDVPLVDVLNGNNLPWKLATWGSHLDQRLLESLERRFDSIAAAEKKGLLIVSQTPDLRLEEVKQGRFKTERIPELKDKKFLDVKELKRLRGFFCFPKLAIKDNDKLHLQLRGGKRGLQVCRPPHVIVSAARNFAIYTDKYLIVPSRQIGIISPKKDKNLLKAISLFLSSDFALYHQLLTSSEFGVKRPRATLGALKQMPMPLGRLSKDKLKVWTNIHSKLVKATQNDFNTTKEPLFYDKGLSDTQSLLKELNRLVYDSLEMNKQDRALVDDLVHVRFELNDGKLGKPAVRKPTKPEIHAYAESLRSDLDTFIEGELPKRHRVEIVYDDLSGMVQVDLVSSASTPRPIKVVRADQPTAKQLEKTRKRLRVKRSQWVYFDRNLHIYEGTRTFILKPMQRFHWTESQARCDAREVVPESIARGELT